MVDINKTRIEAWLSNELPIYEPGLYDVVRAARDGITAGPPTNANASFRSSTGPFNQVTQDRISYRKPSLIFSTDMESAIAEADLIFVCVNTPTKATGVGKGAAANLGFIETATRTVANVAKTDKIVVEKSTVPCRTAESIRAIVSR